MTPRLPLQEGPFFPQVRVSAKENMIRAAETQLHRRIEEKEHWLQQVSPDPP